MFMCATYFFYSTIKPKPEWFICQGWLIQQFFLDGKPHVIVEEMYETSCFITFGYHTIELRIYPKITGCFLETEKVKQVMNEIEKQIRIGGFLDELGCNFQCS